MSHAKEVCALDDRPGLHFARAHTLKSQGHRRVRRKYVRGRPHGPAHLHAARLGARFRGRKVDTLLLAQRVVNRLFLKLVGNEECDQVGDHQRDDDGVVPGDLENHDHRGQRRAHDSREGRAHPYQRVSAGFGGVAGQQGVRHASHRSSDHRSDEQARAEDASGVPRGIAYRRRDNLEHRQHGDHAQHHVPV